MNCLECSYYYLKKGDGFCHCHWESRCPDVPPCEEEDEPIDHEDYSEYDTDLV